MQSLPELQRAFVCALIEGNALPLSDTIVGARGMDSASAMAVYRNNVYTNYRNALRDDYPAILALVGEGFFRGACDAYIRSQPSRSGDLNDFGGAFAEFLQSWPPARALSYLPDVARLEWAMHLALHAADAHALELARLAQAPGELLPRLYFGLHPSARLIESAYPVLRIWEMSQKNADTGQRVDLDSGPERLLVIRRQDGVEVEPLAHAEWNLLYALAAHNTLGDAYASAHRIDADFDLAGFLQRHVLAQTLVSFEIPATADH